MDPAPANQHPPPVAEENAADRHPSPAEAAIAALTDLVWDGKDPGEPLESLAARCVTDSAGMDSPDKVLQRVRDRLTHRILAHDKALSELRRFIVNHTVLRARLHGNARDKKREFAKYKDFSQPLRQITHAQLLVLERGERKKCLDVKADVDDDGALKLLNERLIKSTVPVIRFQMESLVAELYHQEIRPKILKEIREQGDSQAEDHVRTACEKQLEALLRLPILRGKKILVVESGRDSGYCAVVVDPHGMPLRSTHFTFLKPAEAAPVPASATPTAIPAEAEATPVVNPAKDAPITSSTAADTAPVAAAPIVATAAPAPTQTVTAAPTHGPEVLLSLIKEFSPALVAVSKGAENQDIFVFLRGFLSKHEKMPPVNWVHAYGAAFDVSVKSWQPEFPQLSLDEVRCIAVARRLLDPADELGRLPFTCLRLHPLQEEVDAAELAPRLRKLFEAFVATRPIDLNAVSFGTLRFAAGLGDELAKAIAVQRRKLGGRFKTRQELLHVKGIDEALLHQICRQIRLSGGSQPLDQSALLPDNYELIRRIAEHLQKDFSSLIRKPGLLREVDLERFATPTFPTPLIRKLLDELTAPPPPDSRYDYDILSLGVIATPQDLKEGLLLKGRVTSLTEYGAFVDVGISQDGLVHKTQMAGQVVHDPTRYWQLGQVVNVKVLKVDADSARVHLTAKVPQDRLRHESPADAAATPPAHDRRPPRNKERAGQTRSRPDGPGSAPRRDFSNRPPRPRDSEAYPRAAAGRPTRPHDSGARSRDRGPRAEKPKQNVFGTLGAQFKVILNKGDL